MFFQTSSVIYMKMNVGNNKYYKCMMQLICAVFLFFFVWIAYVGFPLKEILFFHSSEAMLSNISDSNTSIRSFESMLLKSSPSLNPGLFTKKRGQQAFKIKITTHKQELTTLGYESTTHISSSSTHKLELTTVKIETSKVDPELTTLNPMLTTPKSDVTTVEDPDTTFKYNFTLVHETWPTIFFNATIPKSNFSRNPKGIVRRKLTILPQPQVMPPTMTRSNASDGDRYLVYLCDGRHLCGGMGDRQRALVSVYVLSRIVKRRFSMKMISPCNITHFFAPFKVQWLPPPDLESPTNNNTINTMGIETRIQFYRNLTNGDFNKMFPQKVLHIKTNSDLFHPITRNPFYASILKQWNGLLNNRGRFHWAWGELMQPTTLLLSELVSILGVKFLQKKDILSVYDDHYTKLKSRYDVGNASLICAHMRVGQNPSNPLDGAFTAATVEDLPALHNFMLSKDTKGDAMFYVASDYINVRILSHNFFGKRFLEYGAQIKHIDRQRFGSDVCDGFKWTIVDQFILSLCDVLVMSPSGFSLRANYINNSTGATYILENGKIYPYYE